MAETVKKGDVVVLEYEGYISATGELFDTTSKDVALAHDKYKGEKLKPLTIMIGERMIVKGLDNALVGKEIGKEYEVELPPEEAFGKYDPKKIVTYPLSAFTKQGVMPRSGEIISLGNTQGKILSVSSGRVKVDLNHPLSGKKVKYKFRILEKVEDPAKKLVGLFRTIMQGSMEIDENKIKYDSTSKKIILDKKYENVLKIVKEIKEIYLKDEIKDVEIGEVKEKQK